MHWEVDHVFFASADGASVEAALSEFGIAFTERRVHLGQGTANACAVFENAFFELLLAADTDELRSDLIRPLGLYERISWRETGACPFGICFRPEKPVLDDSASWPFETWAYAPPYAPAGKRIPVVTPRHSLYEPLVFLSPQSRPMTTRPKSPAHRGASRMLTSVTVHRTRERAPISDGLRCFAKQGLLSLVDNSAYRLELEWDNGRTGQVHEFPASVPVTIRW